MKLLQEFGIFSYKHSKLNFSHPLQFDYKILLFNYLEIFIPKTTKMSNKPKFSASLCTDHEKNIEINKPHQKYPTYHAFRDQFFI